VSADLGELPVGRWARWNTGLRRDRWASLSQRAVALAFWFVLPLLCLFVLVYGTDKLARHLNNVPAGTLGTYTVTSHSCSRELCITGGTFTSVDGRIVEDDLIGVYSWQDGETHRALYDSESVDVIPLPAHWDPTATFVGMAGALGFVVLWSWLLYGSIRRRVLEREHRLATNIGPAR
jgi:hypothetical protein